MSGFARTWLTLVASLVLLVSLAFALVAWRAHRSLSDRPGEVIAALSEAIDLPVEADGVHVTWWPPGLVVHGLRIPDESPLGPGDLVHADEARLVVRGWPLLTGTVVVQRVEVVSPVVRLVRGVEGGWNFSGRGSLEPSLESAPGGGDRAHGEVARSATGSSTALEFDIVDVVLGRGRISLRDRAVPGVPEFEISSMDARLRRRGGAMTLEFEGSALGGPPGNLRGTLEVPADEHHVTLAVNATGVPASRLPEVTRLARGGIPFGATLEGVVAAEVSGQFPRQWPPGPAVIGVLVDAREASASMASGYLRKPIGTPLIVGLELHAGPDLLQVRRATFESGDAKVDLSSAEANGPVAEGQPVLQIASANLTAAMLAEWVPLLAAVAPTGQLTLQGRIAPGDTETAVHVRLSGTDLGVRIGPDPAELGAAALAFDVRPKGRFTAEVSIDDLRSNDLFAGHLAVAFEGGAGEPTMVRIDGARGGRGDAELERLALECEVAGERAEVRRLDVVGLGGTLHAEGELARDEADALSVRFAPQWDGLDFGGLLRLFGVDVEVQGLFTGRAALSARHSAEEALLETLTGVFDARLEEGSLPDLNLARATVSNLSAIPGVRQAIERGAEEKVPGLLARTSRIESLSADGSIDQGVVSVSNLRLDAPDYSIDAAGRVTLDGGVDLDGDLVLGGEATDALVSASGILAVLAPDGKEIRIPVSIEGTYPELVSAPSPAFTTGSIAGSVGTGAAGGAEGFLRRLFGGGDRAGEPEAAGEPRP